MIFGTVRDCKISFYLQIATTLDIHFTGQKIRLSKLTKGLDPENSQIPFVYNSIDQLVYNIYSRAQFRQDMVTLSSPQFN